LSLCLISNNPSRNGGNKEPVLLDELQAHLREEIEWQIKSGLSKKDAFQMAVQQMGKAVMLKNEFKKIGGASIWLERLMIGVCALAVGFIIFLGSATVIMYSTSLSDRLIAASAMACTVAVLFFWKSVVPFLPVIMGKWKRLSVGMCCMLGGWIMGPFYADEILPCFIAPGWFQESPMAFWTAFIVAVFNCVGMGLALDERGREHMGIKPRLKKRKYV
jgi:hypothetical protein